MTKKNEIENLPAVKDQDLLLALLQQDDELDGPLPPEFGSFLPSLRFAWQGSAQERVNQFHITGDKNTWLPKKATIVSLLKGRTAARHAVKLDKAGNPVGDDEEGDFVYTVAVEGSEKTGDLYTEMSDKKGYEAANGGRVSKGAVYLVGVHLPEEKVETDEEDENGNPVVETLPERFVIAEFQAFGTLFSSTYPWINEALMKKQKGFTLVKPDFTTAMTKFKSGGIGLDRGKFAGMVKFQALTKDQILAFAAASGDKDTSSGIQTWVNATKRAEA